MTSPFRPAPDPALDIDRAVLALIRERTWRMSAISRDSLREQVVLLVDRVEKISDRQVREAIERLRQTPEGAFICSSSGASGYWYGTYEEVQEVYAEERKRALNLLARIRKQRDLASRAVNGRQMGLFG